MNHQKKFSCVKERNYDALIDQVRQHSQDLAAAVEVAVNGMSGLNLDHFLKNNPPSKLLTSAPDDKLRIYERSLLLHKGVEYMLTFMLVQRDHVPTTLLLPMKLANRSGQVIAEIQKSQGSSVQ